MNLIKGFPLLFLLLLLDVLSVRGLVRLFLFRWSQAYSPELKVGRVAEQQLVFYLLGMLSMEFHTHFHSVAPHLSHSFFTGS